MYHKGDKKGQGKGKNKSKNNWRQDNWDQQRNNGDHHRTNTWHNANADQQDRTESQNADKNKTEKKAK